MNTQTHLLIAAALLARPLATRANIAVVAGALVPDAGVYGLFAWSKLAGVAEREVWRTIYFAEPMQTVQAVCNSVPLYAALLLLGLALGERPMPFPATSVSAASVSATSAPATSAPASSSGGGSAGGWRAAVGPLHPLALFALAALAHLAADLPVHADDAHRHFWPLTDWRFHSPISYWDRDHHGGLASMAEAVLGVVLCVVLWRRFGVAWVRVLLALAALTYVAVPLYFTLVLGGG